MVRGSCRICIHLGGRSSARFGVTISAPSEYECAVVEPDVVENVFYAGAVWAEAFKCATAEKKSEPRP